MTNTRTTHRSGQEQTALEGPVLNPQAVKAYEGMMADVPEAESGSYDRILEQLAEAKSLTDLEAPWRARGGEQYLGTWLRFRGIRKSPSEFKGGIPWYLIVDAVTIPDGELATFTTGSLNVVAQLVRAHALGLFPFTAMLVESERETASGQRPQRLVFEG